MTQMSLENVTMRFGHFHAVADMSFCIERGEILGVAGPNGAGKSTLMNVCTGGHQATAGTVALDGRDITRLKRHRRCGLGIAQTFQIPTLLSSVTVGENLLAGQIFGREVHGEPSAVGMDEILYVTQLEDQLSLVASHANLLVRKRVMLGAALATGPAIIFMDEPLGGLNADEVIEFLQVIRHVREELGITIVMVEHKTRALAKIADRILIMNFGKLVMLDMPEVVLNDDHVVEIYLGKKHSA